jgi:hypothetical protein
VSNIAGDPETPGGQSAYNWDDVTALEQLTYGARFPNPYALRNASAEYYVRLRLLGQNRAEAAEHELIRQQEEATHRHAEARHASRGRVRKSCSCGEAWADEPGHDDNGGTSRHDDTGETNAEADRRAHEQANAHDGDWLRARSDSPTDYSGYGYPL